MSTKKHDKNKMSRRTRGPGSRRTKRKIDSSRRQKQSNHSGMILGAILGVVFILLVVGLMWQAGSSGTATDLAPPEVLAQGETIYRENCVACHGDNGEGNIGPALNGSAHAWHHPDAQLLSFIRDGIPGTQMTAQGDKLSEEEINAVISYLKSWWAPQQRRMQQQGRH